MKPFVTFKQLGEYGRLGNQLWQWAALRAASLRTDSEIRIPPLDSKWWHGQKCQLDKFDLEYEHFTWRDSSRVRHHFKEKNPMKYDPTFRDVKPYTDILGFFQSIHYFEEFQQTIADELYPQKHVESKKSVIKDLKELHDCDTIVSVGVRRGDNVDKSNPQQYHFFKNLYGDGELDSNSIFGRYMQKFLEVFDSPKTKFLVFTGGTRQLGNSNDSDVEWCKRNFDSDKFIVCEQNDAFEDFCLTLCCDGHVMSYASSFSWWTCYLSWMRDNSKTVVAPYHYHVDMPEFTHRDGFYRNEWILL